MATQPDLLARPTRSPAFRRLARSFSGDVIGPTDASYDEHRRVWNGSIDRRPALIARCTGVDDVVAALRFARETGLPIAVRGGGHSFPGHSTCDDGVVIDLGPMKRIDLHPETRRVRVQGGVLLGELDRATQEFGLAAPLGSVTHTGLAGLTLGGGFGWLMRKYGLAVDQLLEVEVVTADGVVRRANAGDHADLFWAVRGGGGNFGIVTRFDFQLQPVGPTVLSGLLIWPLDEAAEMTRRYRAWAGDAPDELTTALVMRRAPALDPIPAELHGQPIAAVGCCWVGAMEEGEAVLGPMRRGGSVVDLVGPRPYVEHQAMFDAGFPPGLWVYSKASNVRELSDDVLDVMLHQAREIRSPRSAMVAWQLGGAVGRVGELETAFGGRSSGYLIDMLGATDSAAGFAAERDWAREGWSLLTPHRAGVYVNWLMEEGDAGVREAYGAARYARLQTIKRRYDPDNAFRLNQNVPPG